MRVSRAVTFFAVLRVGLLDLFLAGFVAICLTLSMDAGENAARFSHKRHPPPARGVKRESLGKISASRYRRWRGVAKRDETVTLRRGLARFGEWRAQRAQDK